MEWSQGTISTLSKSTIIGENFNFSREWTVSFDYKPNVQAEPNSKWSNIIYFTNAESVSSHPDDAPCGDRYPAVFLMANTNDIMAIESCVNNSIYYEDFTLKNEWNSIKVGQKKIIEDDNNEVFIYFINIDGNTLIETINSDPKDITGLKVYASDPVYAVANGEIKNLIAKTSQNQGKT